MSRTITALLIPATGAARVVDVPKGFREMAAAIDASYIERVRTPIRDVSMYVDEEGLFTSKNTNGTVSGRLYPAIIVGDVLITGEAHTMDGLDAADLTSEQLAQVFELLGVEAPEGVSA